MRYAPQALLAGGLGFAVSCLVACGGGSGLLTGDQASSLNGQLDQVSSALAARQCGAAASAATGLHNAVDNLPASISSTLVNNLRQGVSTVEQLTAQDCRQSTTTTTSTPSTSSSTTSSTTSTPSTSTTPTTTTSSSSSTGPPQTIPIPPATTTSSSGTSSTGSGSGSGGAGLPGGGGSGGAGTGNGNGNGNGQ